ncbi:MAG TPA: hypothetical protein P5300_01880 [Acidobacteriota bacterium]|nr:hypothetical protein [Acidobacteriota bacterium]
MSWQSDEGSFDRWSGRAGFRVPILEPPEIHITLDDSLIQTGCDRWLGDHPDAFFR